MVTEHFSISDSVQTCQLGRVGKGRYIVGTQVQYTFKVAKLEKIFDFLVKEKFITFPKDLQIPNKDEPRGNTYCKYHNSRNHTTNACWSFRNVI